ncbi:MAG: type II toxin-antitoxin system Phd/YefM family antitoxin [Acidobacteriaceae bacterium]
MKRAPTLPIPATQFKAQCLAILDTVQRTRTTVIISKRGKAVAKLVPIDTEPVPSLYGSMKGTGREIGDIVSPIEDEWDAARDE